LARDLYYWDANTFSGYLNEEPDKLLDCEPVLNEARKGHILLVTSALTLAEVLFIRKGGPKLPPEKRELVETFFKADYITVRNVTRSISELARDLFWDHSIDPKDCVHVSTAAFFKVPILHTFAKCLLGNSGITVNGHTLKIERPHVSYQMDMIDESEREPSEEQDAD
jgi:predicted nucleic acid-binding protein